MKALVVFYSRTGNTRKVAHAVADTIGCDIEEVLDTADRSGPLGFLAAGKDAMMGTPAKIREPKADPARYDLVIVGTPVWSWNVSSPIRAYLSRNSGRLKQVAFFCTLGSKVGKTMATMEELGGRKPVALMQLTAAEVAAGGWGEKLKEFVRALGRSG